MTTARPDLRSRTSDISPASVEDRALAIGRQLFAVLGRGPSVLDRTWWDDRLMGLTLADPAVKVQLFRFIDALPSLRTPEAVVEHLADYLEEAGERVPGWLRSLVQAAPAGTTRGEILARGARAGAEHMARRFIAGTTPTEALRTVTSLRRRGLAFTADLLGEAVISEAEADAYQRACVNLLRGLAGPLADEREIPRLDRDDLSPIPRVNLSLKLTSLTAHFDALHAEETTDRVLARLRPILRTARVLGAFVNVDMEQYAHKNLTYNIFRRVLDEPEFRDWSDVGIVAQAYLRDTEGDLRRLAEWSTRRGAPVSVRLVKGAYWDFEVTFARQVRWPVPVFLAKWETDANYERCTRLLLEHREALRPAFGSHNVRSIAHALACADELGVPSSSFEIQVLHGMGEPIARAVSRRGIRARVYTPYGALLPGMAYLVRRLLENTSNESFLKASTTDYAAIEELLKNPEEVGAMRLSRTRNRPASDAGTLPPFRNEPPTDFSREENRRGMRQALDEVRSRLGQTYPIRIGGRALTFDPNRIRDASLDPCFRSEVIGWTPCGTLSDAEACVKASRLAFGAWAGAPAFERSGVLLRAASLMRSRRFELAAWEVFECAKPWREADADVAEAIDFCEFYARRMIALGEVVHGDVPGETNAVELVGRGVVVVIPPWNFPLAIPCGMTVAALVAGNAVILKPAEQSPIIAAHLVSLLKEAGLPPGVLSFLPGRGEEVGQALVDHPDVDVIAFTGSRPVGLEINRRASEPRPGQDHVKRVIAEMGGKNAIIVDQDADLDEAVTGVIQSAFGYGGQKCSACSRVILLDPIHDAFVSRLAEALRAVVVGPAERPETVVPALIDPNARRRVLDYAKIAMEQGARALFADRAEALAELGNFVGPHVFVDVKPTDRIAQEEIFGPLLAVLRARDLDEALAIANGTDYALTGGLYSRSPSNIERVKRGFLVGNLYINRTITGALVGRQPFGGFKLSGIGTKAGGDDYLREFLRTRTITENTLRRGFAPEDVGSDAMAVEATTGI